MKKLFKKVEFEVRETLILLKNIPSLVVALFMLSIIMMNLLAAKELVTVGQWFALDCGLLVSWLSFLSMDIIVKRFGAKASIRVSIVATLLNILCFGIISLCALIPDKDPSFPWFMKDYGSGTNWWILGGSTAAFIVSAVINSLVNEGIGKMFKSNPNGRPAYVARTYVSTFIGQVIDNLVFALLVSKWLFDWSYVACFTCALTGGVVELVCEIIFSPIGYKICNDWNTKNTGVDYLIVDRHIGKIKKYYKEELQNIEADTVSTEEQKKVQRDIVTQSFYNKYNEILNYKWKLGERQ